MPHMSPERYAVVSCHVERPLDDRVWRAFSALRRDRPGGFSIAALIRPPDADEVDRWDLWSARAAEAAADGLFGHHTHWTSSTHARPSGAVVPGSRVRREATELRRRGHEPTMFCGGGWYTDRAVAEACAEAGYIDCTPRSSKPGYLTAGALWAQLSRPARVRLGASGRLVVVPTTHSIGDVVRAMLLSRWGPEPVVHVYFHDTDLLDRRRRAALILGLQLLGRRCVRSDVVAVARHRELPEIDWADLERT